MDLKRVDQRSFWSPEGGLGDCMTASVATLLGLPYEAVPFFTKIEKETGHWFPAFSTFLKSQGYEYVGTYSPRFQHFGPPHADADWAELQARCPGVNGLYMAGGPSPRGAAVAGGHAVVIDMHGKLVHDPHPSREGLVEIHSVYMIQPIKP